MCVQLQILCTLPLKESIKQVNLDKYYCEM